MTENLSSLFANMPLDRILSGFSSLADGPRPEFAGPIATAIDEIGVPTFIVLHMQILPNNPTWSAFWRAEWTGYGSLWGALDPSAFIVLFNSQAKIISDSNILLSIQSPKILPTETIVLTDSFQPEAIIWNGNIFKTAPLFFCQKPPPVPRKIPNFLR